MIILRFIIVGLFIISNVIADDDYLHFANKDRLIGSFAGFDENLNVGWKREGIQSILFIEKDAFEKVIINKGYAKEPLKNHSYLSLHTGEIIPGSPYRIDGKSIHLRSQVLGEISSPLNICKRLSFESKENQAIYLGPYSSEQWIQHPDLSNRSDDDLLKGWRFDGTSWISQDETPLFTNLNIPESFSLNFKLSWDNQIYFSVAMLCEPDMNERSELAKAKQAHGIRRHPYLFGECYTISFIGNHLNISQVKAKDHSHPKIVHTAQTLLLKKKQRQAHIQINYDSRENKIAISIDGEPLTQWSGAENGANFTGKQIGFSHTNSFNSISLSDFSLRPWSDRTKLPGTEISKESHQVVLNNEQGQISCENLTLINDILTLESSYGELQAPIAELREINFAKPIIKKDRSVQNLMRISFFPIGYINMTPTHTEKGIIHGKHNLLGNVQIHEDFIASIEVIKTSENLQAE